MGLPSELFAVRHGQSTANLALSLAAGTGALETELTGRDADIPLSPLGHRQAESVGHWLASLAPARIPEAVVCSSYLRARQTTEVALRTAELTVPVEIDTRLRDRELGRLELLTHAAVLARYPEEADRRKAAGELHYRPPDGESMWDVADRVRAALHDLGRRHPDQRVLIVAHDAVILMLRAIIEDLSCKQLATIDQVANGSISRWQARDGTLHLSAYNLTGHLPRA